MTYPLEFKGWPKTPRLFRDMIITEKIDGTNAAVIVQDAWDVMDGRWSGYTRSYIEKWAANGFPVVEIDGRFYLVGAQSRKRVITPQDDNFGFAKWVYDHAEELARLLGSGYHFGEWWGSGIQRGYGLKNGEKRFSLFNVTRYYEKLYATGPGLEAFESELVKSGQLSTVPVLHQGPFDLLAVDVVRNDLARNGSVAARGFDRPEGVIVFHNPSGHVYKSTIENDDSPKGE